MRRKRCAACVGRSRSLPGNQTVDRDRGLPVSYGAHPAQPHRVRDAGLESSETPGLPEPEDRLPDQARLAARLSRPTAQESQRSDGSCVSPTVITTYKAYKNISSSNSRNSLSSTRPTNR